MGSEIRDPVTQVGATVFGPGKTKRLFTSSMVHKTPFVENLENQQAYVMNLPAVVLGSNWVWAVIKNTNDLDLIVERCVLWTATSKSNDFVAAYTRGAFTYSANGTATTPSQCNSGGALNASVTAYYNDAVGDLATITAGQECGAILVTSTPQEFKIGSHWVIPKNQIFYLKSELANDNTYKGWIEFYFHQHT